MRISKLPSPVALAIVVSLLPSTVTASCAGFPPLEQHLAQADVVLVGAVQSVTNQDRTAQVEVHEIWSGGDVPQQVTIHGGSDDPNVIISTDRYYRPGVRYLFALQARDGRLEDNACTATHEWTDDLAALRPADATSPPAITADDEGGSVPTALIVIGLAMLAVASVSIVAFRARH